MFLVVLLSVVCAALIASSAVLQQSAARTAADAPDRGTPSGVGHRFSALLPVLGVVRALIRSRLWVIGWLVNLAGFFVQAAALHFGSVAVVQPLLVVQLLFTLAIVSARERQRPRAQDWAAALSICAAVAVFLSVRGAAPQGGATNRAHLIIAFAVCALLVGALVAGAYGRRPAVHTTSIALAAGVCFAVTAALMKLTTADLLDRGVPATAVDWPGYSLAVVTAVGLLLEQEAFGVGPLPVAIAAMAVANPVISYLIGVLAFDIHVNTGPSALAAVSGAGVLLFLGAVGLAHAPSVQQDVSTDVLDIGTRSQAAV